MENTQRVDQIIRDRAEDAARYAGVDVLAFHRCECPTSLGRYHAIGAYRVNGELCIRHIASEFDGRIAETAKDLYLDTLYSVDNERDNAALISDRWSGLPPALASLIDRAAIAAPSATWIDCPNCKNPVRPGKCSVCGHFNTSEVR